MQIIEEMIKTAIPLSEVKFQSSVDTANKKPSEYYSENSNNPDRRAEIFLTPHLVFCRQMQVNNGQWFGTSTANMKSFRVKPGLKYVIEDPQIIEEETDLQTSPPIMPKKRGRPFKNPS